MEKISSHAKILHELCVDFYYCSDFLVRSRLGPFFLINAKNQRINRSCELSTGSIAVWMTLWGNGCKRICKDKTKLIKTSYLSRALRAVLILAFIDLTDASGSFLDACRSKESSSSSDLQKQNSSVGVLSFSSL